MTTNFYSITESPEKLADFLQEISFDCRSGGEGYCGECKLKKCCGSSLLIREWLQEEASDD